MLDNQLITLLSTQIDAALANAGWPYIVSQKVQPEQEGVPTTPTVFFQKLDDHEYGQQSSEFTYRPSPGDFEAKEMQVVVTMFQVTSLVIQNPSDLSIPTASDVLQQIKMYLQHRITMATMRAAGASLIRITDIRNPYFVDDKMRYEAHPSFDVHLQHERSVSRSIPAATSVIGAPSAIPGDLTTGVFPVISDASDSYP